MGESPSLSGSSNDVHATSANSLTTAGAAGTTPPRHSLHSGTQKRPVLRGSQDDGSPRQCEVQTHANTHSRHTIFGVHALESGRPHD